MKSFGDLFKNSMNEFSEKFTPILKNFLVFYVIPSILLVIVVGIIFLTAVSVNGITFAELQSSIEGLRFFSSVGKIAVNSALLVVLGLVFLVYIIANIFLTISYIYIGFSKDKNVSLSKSFNAAKEFFWRYLGLWILTALALTGLFILLIVPGVIFMVYWVFASFILMYEKKDIIESLKRSKALVKGRWWRTFGFVVLFAVIITVASFVLSLLPFIGGLISALIIQPFATLFFKNFYLDMKKK